jgi:hypothetical protein
MMRELCAVVAGDQSGCPDEARLAEFIALARAHRVHLLVARQLARLEPRPACGAEEELRVEARVEALRDMVRVGELLRVVAALEASGCDPVVFKGAALALTHYEQSRLRPRLDADVIVDPASRARAASTLARLGYARPPMTGGRYVMHQEMHVRPDPVVGEHVIDLHWRLLNPNLLAALPGHAELRARAARVLVAEGVLHAASPADALVIACVHRAAHHADADELLWLHDIHLVASGLTVHEWSLVMDIIERARVTALVARGLQLAARAFGECVPATIRDMLQSAGREASALFLRRDLRPLDRLRADVAALGAAGGARLVAEHLFPPASYMREKYGLRSGAQLPLAYVRRIVRGAAGWLRR